MKRLISIALSAILAVTATTSVIAVTTTPDTATITIAHTNDIHGRNSLDDYNKTIGFPKLKAIVDNVGADLLLDAGDYFHGQAFATVEKGESMAQVMNALGYDAMTPGNHDWNYGQDQLLKLQEISKTPILAGNIIKDGTEKFLNTDYIIKNVDGVKIGVFGVIDPDVYSSTNPTLLNGIEYTDMYDYSTKMVNTLNQQGCDVVVALSHCVDHEKFTKNVSGVDLLICGHLHQVINETVNGTLIVEAGEYMQNVGVVSIAYNKSEDKIEQLTENVISYEDSKEYQENSEVKALIDTITAEQSLILDQIVGSTDQVLDGEKFHVRAYETNLGRVVTDAYLNETGADIAIENGGGIRSSIQAGNITKRDIINVAPFGNYIVTKQVKGSDVWQTIEDTIELGRRNLLAFNGESTDWPTNDGSYLQVGGITVSYNSENTYGSRVESILVGTQPIDLEKLYLVAGNNFIMADTTYAGIANSAILSEYTTCDDALTKFISTKGVEKSVDTKRFIDTSVVVPTEPTNPTEPTQPTEPTTATEPVTATQQATTAQSTTAKATTTTTASGTTATGKVATGDSTHIVLLLLMLTACGAVVVNTKRKRNG